MGSTKPEMKMLLEPIMRHLRRLCTIGLDFVTPSGHLITIRMKVMMGIFDLPAKAAA